jgi:hypothetical protein
MALLAFKFLGTVLEEGYGRMGRFLAHQVIVANRSSSVNGASFAGISCGGKVSIHAQRPSFNG